VTRTEGHYRVLLGLLTLLVAAWTVVWAVVTPAFRSPDEQNHVNSVLRIAHGGGWPPPGEARFSPVIEDAVEEAAYPADLPGRFGALREDVRQFVDVVPVPREERARADATTAVAPSGSDATVDQMTQHPPAYYALGAAVLHLTGLAEARWDQVMLALRVLDAALLAASVPFAAAAVRRVTGSRSAALLAVPLPLLVPQVGHILGSTNNDALVVLVCAVVTYLGVRVVTGDLRWRTAAAIGVALGVGLLTKVMVAFAVPTVLVAYLLAVGAPWQVRLTRAAAATGVALVAGGWWWVRNVLTLGVVQPAGLPRDVSRLAQVPDDEVLPLSVSRVAQSFFGQLGWLEVRLDGTFVVLGSVVVVAASVLAVVLPGARRTAVALLVMPAGLAAGVIYNAVDFHAETGVLVALQGRYVFGGITALAAVVAVAVWHALGDSSRRVVVALPVATALALAVAGTGLWWGFRMMYLGPGESHGQAVDRWLAWSPLEGWQVTAVLVAAAAVALVAVAGTVRWAVLVRREDDAA
jgi:hypothetical protein